MKRNDRYRTMERYITYALLIDLGLFMFYLLWAGLCVIWLKAITAVVCLLLSALILIFLYLTKELRRPRSLWMTTGAGAIALCLLFSLLLNFP